MVQVTESEVWEALAGISDPEIPVISIVELGIVREVAVDSGEVTVVLTPTFSGCPALDVMRANVHQEIERLGARSITVETVVYPPWSTDWISPEGRIKLKEYGIAPPARHGGKLRIAFFEPVSCPRCDSENTSIKNSFGSTLCRAIYYCNDCQEPFEQFKPL